MDLSSSTILITGGTSGIGFELAKQLIERGATVLITGRKINALNEAKKKIPGVHVFQSDVSKQQEIETLYASVIQQFPKLNILVNNAGIMRLIDLQQASSDLEDINREIATNLSGTIQMVQQFLPHLTQQKSAAIVNVSSAIAVMPLPLAPVYSASKAGVRAYTRALRLQLEGSPVKVFEVIPPSVGTNLQKEWGIAMDTSMDMPVEKMASVIVKALEKNTFEIKPMMTQILMKVNGLLPNTMIRIGNNMFKKMTKAT
jgi:uncharacterized oxidoreductase